ncbi:MAG: ABC transporter permease [Deltaproteobacteria bacterium]|nr:ABC transporter permease [Deltaproteobacteria bacterium]
MGNGTPFVTLLRQEWFRFTRLWKQTIFPPIVTTILFILIFGFSLGDRIREIHGLSYILFIVPGLAAMGAMMNAHTNCSFALYMSRFDQSIDNMLAAPLRSIELVTAFLWGGIARGMLVGLVTLAVSLLLLKQPPYHLGWTLFFLITQTVFFGCWGIVGALRAKTWDNLATAQNFIITPLIYLGGVFYSVDLLPGIWRTISGFNPLLYMIDGTRYGVLGVHDLSLLTSAGLSAGMSLGMFALCVILFQKGYRLVR